MTTSTFRNRPRLHNRHSFTFFAGALVGAALLGGCKKDEGQTQEKNEAPVASSAAPHSPAATGGSASARESAVPAHGSPQPIGPALVVVPGVGLSAIRFGATFDTVERHMGAPCDIRTENRCGYVRQAVEFTMTDGVVSGMSVQRRDRQVKNPGRFPKSRMVLSRD